MYVAIMESLFFEKYTVGADSIEFTRDDIIAHAEKVG